MEQKKVIYIIGPVNGVPRYYEAFEKMEDELTARGFIPLSPARLPEGLTKEQYTRICYAMIDSADAVVTLPGYEADAGAAMEFSYSAYIRKTYAVMASWFELGWILETLRGVTA